MRSPCFSPPRRAVTLAYAPSPARPPVQSEQSEGERLKALFHASDEANLKRSPLLAIFRGDLRYADRLGDYFSDKAIEEARAPANEQDRAGLAAIDRAKLSPVDQIAYDVFAQPRRHHRARPGAGDRRARDRPADRPFQRRPHLLRRFRLGPGRGAVQDAARL